MKGNISLKDFIREVKEDLQSAVDKENPFFYLGEVELEVSFVLDAQASAGAKLVVVDIGGKTTATQLHKVKIKLIPYDKGSPQIALGARQPVRSRYVHPVVLHVDDLSTTGGRGKLAKRPTAVYIADPKNKRAVTKMIRNIKNSK